MKTNRGRKIERYEHIKVYDGHWSTRSRQKGFCVRDELDKALLVAMKVTWSVLRRLDEFFTAPRPSLPINANTIGQ